MARGLPDWGRIKKPGAVAALADLGELAARLGSIVAFDRRGDVVFLDSFEEGLIHVLPATSGTGAAVAVSAWYARSGGYSCELTAGSDLSHYAALKLLMPLPVLSKVGFEISFAFDADLQEMRLLPDLYDGSSLHGPAVRYDYANTRLQYRDEDSDWQDIATDLDLYQAAYPFWTWKLVCDFVSEEYVRLIVNDVEYSLADLAYPKTASATNPLLRLGVFNYGQAAANGVVYVDDMIVTQNEP